MLETPDVLTTKICFGGPDMRTAWITLGRSGMVAKMEWLVEGLTLACRDSCPSLARERITRRVVEGSAAKRRQSAEVPNRSRFPTSILSYPDCCTTGWMRRNVQS